jgi:hypothetical protein
MKKILVFILMVFSLPSFGQQTQTPTPDSLYTDIVQVDSLSQNQLFSRAKLFVATRFNSAPDVTKLSDEAAHTIVVKGRLNRFYVNPFNKSLGGAVNFTLKIATKEGKYKYEITDLYHSDVHHNGDYSGGSLSNEKPACGGLFMTKRNWHKIKEDADNQLQQLIQELYASMKAPANQDNW